MSKNDKLSRQENATGHDTSNIWFDTVPHESTKELHRLRAKSWDTSSRE